MLHELGININNIIAGFAGGVVNAFIFKRSDPWSIIGSVIVGSLSANYLTEMIAKIVGTSMHTTAFIVGLGGMAICQGIMEITIKRLGNNGSKQ